MGYWEMAEGTITVPQKEAPRVRKALTGMIDSYRTLIHEAAEKAIERMARAYPKGFRADAEYKDRFQIKWIAEKGFATIPNFNATEWISTEVDKARPAALRADPYAPQLIERIILDAVPANAAYFDPRKLNRITKAMVFRVIPKCKQANPVITLEEATVSATDNSVRIRIDQQKRAVDEFTDSYVGNRVRTILKQVDYGKRGQHGGVIEKQDELAMENFCGPSVLWAFGAAGERFRMPWR